MKGLILKDLINLKKQVKIYAVLMLVYFAIAVFSSDGIYLTGALAIFFATMPISAMSYDERSGWDKYAIAMFISRQNIVKSKYALGIISSFAGAVVSLLFCALQKMKIGEALFISLALFFAEILLNAILLPFMFKLGTEKGRMIMMIGFILPVVIIGILSNVNISGSDQQFILTLLFLVPIGIVGCAVLSYSICKGIYNKKEF